MLKKKGLDPSLSFKCAWHKWKMQDKKLNILVTSIQTSYDRFPVGTIHDCQHILSGFVLK